jgi:hypothetical protein
MQGSQNGSLLIWARCCDCNLIVVFLRLCKCVEVDCIFLMSCYRQLLDSQLENYGVLRISALFWACSQPLHMKQNLPKTAQNCPKLPKSAQRRNFEIPPKIEILVFKKKCFHCSDFQSKNFSYALFIVKKRPLYVNFSIPPYGN